MNFHIIVNFKSLKSDFLLFKLVHFYVAGAVSGLALTKKDQVDDYEWFKQLTNKK